MRRRLVIAAVTLMSVLIRLGRCEELSIEGCDIEDNYITVV